jgi:hypothetical protein
MQANLIRMRFRLQTLALSVSCAIACSAGSSRTIGDAGVLADASSAVDSPAAVVCTPRDLSKSLKSLRVSFQHDGASVNSYGCVTGSFVADVNFLDNGTGELARNVCEATGPSTTTAAVDAETQAALLTNLKQYCVEVNPPLCRTADGRYYLLKTTDAAGASTYAFPGDWSCSGSRFGHAAQGPLGALISILDGVR